MYCNFYFFPENKMKPKKVTHVIMNQKGFLLSSKFVNPSFSERCSTQLDINGNEMGAKVEVKEGSGGVGRELKCMITIFQ